MVYDWCTGVCRCFSSVFSYCTRTPDFQWDCPVSLIGQEKGKLSFIENFPSVSSFHFPEISSLSSICKTMRENLQPFFFQPVAFASKKYALCDQSCRKYGADNGEHDHRHTRFLFGGTLCSKGISFDGF